jgi:uncharacterized membrane protein
MDWFRDGMGLIGTVIDAIGVLIVAVGALVATFKFIKSQGADPESAYKLYRQNLGRAILLGLEFLVAGDIIRTVVVAPSMENVLVLAIIVIIRTFLSFSLQLEVEGRLPWKNQKLESV